MSEVKNKQTILIVGDQPANIRILLENLRSDYDTRVAIEGEVALDIVRSDNPPDLVLLDVMMPGIDGYEVCERMKADPRTAEIPVIFITAKGNEEDMVQGFQSGAVDYVVKPFSPVVVKARVKTHAMLDAPQVPVALDLSVTGNVHGMVKGTVPDIRYHPWRRIELSFLQGRLLYPSALIRLRGMRIILIHYKVLHSITKR